MIHTDLAKHVLAARRERRDMERDGWELVDSGYIFLDMSGGERWREHFTDVRIAVGGKALWVKTDKQKTPAG